MKRLSTSHAVYRWFFRPARGLTIDDQRAAAAMVTPLGATVQEFLSDKLDDWHGLARDTDVLGCYRLELLPPPRSKREGGIPTAKLSEIRGSIKARNLRLIEACLGGKEPDGTRWNEARRSVAHGRKLETGHARKIGKKGGEKKPVQTILDYWMTHPEKAQFAAIWRGADGSYVDALEAVNEAARKRHYIAVSSTTMAWRVFGDRRKLKR